MNYLVTNLEESDCLGPQTQIPYSSVTFEGSEPRVILKVQVRQSVANSQFPLGWPLRRQQAIIMH